MMIFFNFDEDIRKDLIEQGYKGEQPTSKFEKMKKKMSIAMDELIEEAEDDNNDSMDKKEFEKEIDL